MGFFPAGPAIPVSVSQGGTGATTTPGAVAGLGLAGVPWLPGDNGYGWATGTIDGLDGNTFTPTAGVLYLVKVPVRGPSLTISNISVLLSAGGVGASTGTFIGLYSSAGVLLSQDASDIGASLTSSGVAGPFALAAAQTVATPPWVGIITNLATTQPTFRLFGVGSFVMNANLSAANYRCGSTGSLLLTLPASFTPSGLANTGNPVWCAGN